MQMARYSVKLPYLSPYPESTVSNFSPFTLLFTFLFHFLSPHSPLLSFPSVPFYSLSCTPFCAALSLSALLFPPRSRLSLRSEQHMAMNSPPWQWAMNPQEQRRQSLARKKADLFSKILLHLLPLVMTLWSRVLTAHLWQRRVQQALPCQTHTGGDSWHEAVCFHLLPALHRGVSSRHFCVVYKWVSVSLRGQAYHQVCRWFHYFVPAQSWWA